MKWKVVEQYVYSFLRLGYTFTRGCAHQLMLWYIILGIVQKASNVWLL